LQAGPVRVDALFWDDRNRTSPGIKVLIRACRLTTPAGAVQRNGRSCTASFFGAARLSDLLSRIRAGRIHKLYPLSTPGCWRTITAVFDHPWLGGGGACSTSLRRLPTIYEPLVRGRPPFRKAIHRPSGTRANTGPIVGRLVIALLVRPKVSAWAYEVLPATPPYMPYVAGVSRAHRAANTVKARRGLAAGPRVPPRGAAEMHAAERRYIPGVHAEGRLHALGRMHLVAKPWQEDPPACRSSYCARKGELLQSWPKAATVSQRAVDADCRS